MTIRSTSRMVTFEFAFILPGMSEPHRPGTFEVQIDEERLDVSWEAYRTSARFMLSYPGRVEALAVTGHDLEAALLRDQASRVNSSSS